MSYGHLYFGLDKQPFFSVSSAYVWSMTTMKKNFPVKKPIPRGMYIKEVTLTLNPCNPRKTPGNVTMSKYMKP